MFRPTRLVGVIAVTALMMLVPVGTALGHEPELVDDPNVVHACYNSSSGVLKIVAWDSAPCKSPDTSRENSPKPAKPCRPHRWSAAYHPKAC